MWIQQLLTCFMYLYLNSESAKKPINPVKNQERCKGLGLSKLLLSICGPWACRCTNKIVWEIDIKRAQNTSSCWNISLWAGNQECLWAPPGFSLVPNSVCAFSWTESKKIETVFCLIFFPEFLVVLCSLLLWLVVHAEQLWAFQTYSQNVSTTIM